MSDELLRFLARQDALRHTHDMLAATDPYDRLSVRSAVTDFLRDEEERRQRMLGGAELENYTRIFEEAERHRKLLEGPIADAQRLSLFDPGSDLRQSLTAATEARLAYDRLFAVPAAQELDRIARQAFRSTELAQTVFGAHDALQVVMAEMQSPWLRADNEMASARALSEMMAIGHGIDRSAPFGDELSAAIRLSLGDWRDIATPSAEPFFDPVQRVSFYYDRGFHPTLTNFPKQAFDEGLRLAHLREQPQTADDYGDDDEKQRACQAYSQLQEFETVLRRFIEKAMRDVFGDNWMSRQLPNGMLDQWVEKRDKAIDAGQPEHPLIDYADFTDYRKIIERRDNWQAVFKPIFKRAEDIRESFQRLYPVRVATMHSRIITQDDTLLLVVETKRVLTTIKRWKQ